MRQREKEIATRSEIDGILEKARVCRLAFARENEPYLVPVFFGYDGNRLYFHTAKDGKKLEFVAVNSGVCFEVEGDASVIQDPSEACKWSASYESVIGYGHVVELVTPEDKAHGLNQIMHHYSTRDWQFKPESVALTRVWYVEIESITGKRSQQAIHKED